MAGRIIGTRLPCCPGKDSKYTIRHNTDREGSPWWVFYEPPGQNRIPADDRHVSLIDLVNSMKAQMAQSSGGGSFSINEHGQVIARAKAPAGPGNTIHIINVTSKGDVSTYSTPLLFDGGKLDPRSTPKEGQPWPGPLSGMSYKFVAPGNPKPPSRNRDEVFVEEEGEVLQLSVHAGIDPYPPTSGPLHAFLQSLRRRFPVGGRFRVNEHGRAFTSDGAIYIGTIPKAEWFRPLTARS
ncbi:MAG: hypothetical protein HY000_36615 [Planctomycetes bacterium]|nr:hypothetical protein [Planctomycetota bacterium]